MRYVMYVSVLVAALTACQGPGYGVTEQKTEGSQTGASPQADVPPGVPDKAPGFSILSAFASSKEFVRKRLDPGIGKPKAEQVAKFGDPVTCTPNPKGGETCLWHDKGMTEGGTSDPSMHQVYYAFDTGGVAREWYYRGMYGKLSSRDPAPETQAPAPTSTPTP